jgi:hypothetical protein
MPGSQSSVIPFPSLKPSRSQVEPSTTKKKQTRLGVLVKTFSKRAGSLNDNGPDATTSSSRLKRNRMPSGDVPVVKKRRPEPSCNDRNDCLPLRQRTNSSSSVNTIRATDLPVQRSDATTSKKRPLREDSVGVSSPLPEATVRLKRSRLTSGITPEAKKRCTETSTKGQAWSRPRTASSSSIATIRGSDDRLQAPKAPSPPPVHDDTQESLNTCSGGNDNSTTHVQRNASIDSVNSVFGINIDDLIEIPSESSPRPSPSKIPRLAILNPGTGKPAEAVLTPSSSHASEANIMPSLKRKPAIDFRALSQDGVPVLDCDLPQGDFRGLASVGDFDPSSPPPYETITLKPAKPRVSIKFATKHVEVWDASDKFVVSYSLSICPI